LEEMDALSRFDQVWIGFEQEYMLLKDGVPLGWKDAEGPQPHSKGANYCGAGGHVVGRCILEEHFRRCV
jgi:hypothetical protein